MANKIAKKVAFVLGANGSADFSPLKYAKTDAKRIAQTLSNSRYGFEIITPKAPNDPYLIKRELDLLAKSCEHQDTFVFFFSGHGELLAGELMLVLDQTKAGDETTYLPINWVKEARKRCVADNRLLILDCCHAGGAVGAKSGRELDVAELGLESKNELMLLASRRLEIAREFYHLKGSFLTTEMCFFLQSSRGETIALSHLMDHLNTSARSHNANADRGAPKVPIPFLNGDQQGAFLFARRSSLPDLSKFTRIRNQGPEGSPASLAIVTAMEISLAIQGQAIQLSPRYVREKSRAAGQLKNPDGEAFPPVVFIVQHFGAPPESDWPYVACQTELPKDTDWETLDARAGQYKARCDRLRGTEAILDQLDRNRPVVLAVKMYSSSRWMEKDGKIYHPVSTRGEGDAYKDFLGLHCIVIVAKTDDGFRFANSWGTLWGEDGFGTISNAALKAIAKMDDIWAVECLPVD